MPTQQGQTTGFNPVQRDFFVSTGYRPRGHPTAHGHVSIPSSGIFSFLHVPWYNDMTGVQVGFNPVQRDFFVSTGLKHGAMTG